jgi:hypothetical protein
MCIEPVLRTDAVVRRCAAVRGLPGCIRLGWRDTGVVCSRVVREAYHMWKALASYRLHAGKPGTSRVVCPRHLHDPGIHEAPRPVPPPAAPTLSSTPRHLQGSQRSGAAAAAPWPRQRRPPGVGPQAVERPRGGDRWLASTRHGCFPRRQAGAGHTVDSVRSTPGVVRCPRSGPSTPGPGERGGRSLPSRPADRSAR